MKITYIITRSDSIGGAHIHVRDLALALVAKGHDVTVLVGGEGPYTEELKRAGVPFRSLKYLTRPIRPAQDCLALTEIRRHLISLRPDLVSTHSSKAGWLGRLVSRLLKIPVIFTAHGWAFTDGVPGFEQRVYVNAERLTAPLADKIITVSEFDRQLALKYRVGRPESIVTVHNGMPDIEPEFYAVPDKSPPRIIMVARFEPQKDHRTLIEALAGLIDVPWSLELVGDGPLRKGIEELVKSLGMTERVTFLGARRDVAARLAGSQIFILSTNWEGFPRSILEAMRAGLPVIATDVGGVRESVRDGDTGFVVSRGDSQALRARLKLLLENPRLRLEMGQKARKRYEEEFTFNHMFRKTFGVYQEVLADSQDR